MFIYAYFDYIRYYFQRVGCTKTERGAETVVSLAVISFFCFLVLEVVLPSVLTVWMPPTHPSVPMGALRPRVHLASSSVSVDLSPTMATTESFNMLTALFKECGNNTEVLFALRLESNTILILNRTQKNPGTIEVIRNSSLKKIQHNKQKNQ